MRGKAQIGHDILQCFGITPAYAGKRDMVLVFHLNSLGSPPPMRGKGNCRNLRAYNTGITPAYAGKSEWMSYLEEIM